MKDCPNIEEEVSDQLELIIFPVIKDLEDSQECSGVCTKSNTYLMKGLEYGPPPISCETKV